MEQVYNEYYIEKVLIKGYVYYEDFSPANRVIAILEKGCCEYNEATGKEIYKYVYLANTVTNSNGEFCFFVTDRSCYYKIKFFDNNHEICEE